MRTVLPLLAVALIGLAGCTNASLAEAYGRPDPFEWTYFRGSSSDVVMALRVSLSQASIAVESVRDNEDGTVLTVSSRFDQSQSDQILVQSTAVEGFRSRAQLYPGRDPLPRWLETEVAARL